MRSGGPGLLGRLLVCFTPQFAEDWAGFVGELFRRGIKKIDACNRDRAKITTPSRGGPKPSGFETLLNASFDVLFSMWLWSCSFEVFGTCAHRQGCRIEAPKK